MGSNINVAVGNNLKMKTVNGTAEIGHISPESNEWQIKNGVPITQQILDGNITVEVGTNKAGTINGVTTSGGDDALLDGSAGGKVRIGSRIATNINQTDVAAGDIWVRAMADLKVDTAGIGHAEYQHNTTSGVVNPKDAIGGLGSIRNRIWGNTTISAGQLTPTLNANTTPGVLTLKKAEINSGYGQDQGQLATDVGAQLRFFIPSRINLDSQAGNVFNDSAAATAIPVRVPADNHVDGDIFVSNGGKNQENGFQLVSTTATYSNNGDANYAFYFAEPKSASASDPGYSPYINYFDVNDGFVIVTTNGGNPEDQSAVNSGVLGGDDYLGASSGQVDCQVPGNAWEHCCSTETHYQLYDKGYGSYTGFGGQAGGNVGGAFLPVGNGNFDPCASLQADNVSAVVQDERHVAITREHQVFEKVTHVASAGMPADNVVVASALTVPEFNPLDTFGFPVVVTYAPESDIEINQLKRLYPSVLAFASTYGNGSKGL